ncbi:Crp/Fnr family transcriptional regulator [Sphingobacterium sp. SRCM116780]|uniref:Crp/Fnr family transcriptional regulator n=1 Tax=Sphingobacterium sp. SRCM116780 TaxID=2907623 RepID=UPI001F18EF52|nr:Crp/Fnr family transcriptional regulator [Sphingobacterium sp. SRCM116780]UIR55201.1 Crp/Fnr family transcriptional regulator [Sphingobacterium sp. SRCM116780]
MNSFFQNQITQLFEIPQQNLETILASFEEEDLPKGAYFLEEGRRCDRLSFIQSGLVRVFRDTASGQVTQWIGQEGYFITDLSSFLFEQPARWNIQVLGDTKLLSIHRKDYLSFEKHIPDWNRLEKHFIAKCFLQLEDRIYNFIAHTAEERYRLYFEQNKTLFNQVPLQYIASLLGMSPETLSRIRAKVNS